MRYWEDWRRVVSKSNHRKSSLPQKKLNSLASFTPKAHFTSQKQEWKLFKNIQNQKHQNKSNPLFVQCPTTEDSFHILHISLNHSWNSHSCITNNSNGHLFMTNHLKTWLRPSQGSHHSPYQTPQNHSMSKQMLATFVAQEEFSKKMTMEMNYF